MHECEIIYEIMATLDNGTQVSIPLRNHCAEQQWLCKENDLLPIETILNSLTNLRSIQNSIKEGFVATHGRLERKKIRVFPDTNMLAHIEEVACQKAVYQWCYENDFIDTLSVKMKGWVHDNLDTQPTASTTCHADDVLKKPDNPLDYGKKLLEKWPHDSAKRILLRKETFPKLTTAHIGAFARGYPSSEQNKEACESWYQRNKPK